jgi:FkbM family methyltransferase
MEKITKSINNGLVFFTLDNDWNVGDNIRQGNIWEPYVGDFIKENLNKDSVFIDVGSNYGYHSLIASKYCKEVFSYEPQRVLYLLQLKSINDNKIDNINLFNCAVGYKNNEIEIFSNMSKYLYFIENIMHFEDCKNTYYVNYSLFQLSSLFNFEMPNIL